MKSERKKPEVGSLDDEDIQAINAADEQIDRGEYVEFPAFAAEMRKKFCNATPMPGSSQAG